jgi:hypothetical protein
METGTFVTGLVNSSQKNSMGFEGNHRTGHLVHSCKMGEDEWTQDARFFLKFFFLLIAFTFSLHIK